jgi:hypothetical protein
MDKENVVLNPPAAQGTKRHRQEVKKPTVDIAGISKKLNEAKTPVAETRTKKARPTTQAAPATHTARPVTTRTTRATSQVQTAPVEPIVTAPTPTAEVPVPVSTVPVVECGPITRMFTEVRVSLCPCSRG